MLTGCLMRRGSASAAVHRSATEPAAAGSTNGYGLINGIATFGKAGYQKLIDVLK
jgi:hypothetical protein